MIYVVLILLSALSAYFLDMFHVGGMSLTCAIIVGGWLLWKRKISLLNTLNVCRFLLDFIDDLVRSNLIMLYDVITPTDLHKVRLVRVPVGDMSDVEILILHHRINLSPGTLVVHIDSRKKYLVVHEMYGSGEDRAAQIRKPIEILRGKGRKTK